MSLPTAHDSEQLDAVEDRESYRLLGIEAAHTPEGCVGRNWFVYRIAQGKNSITGYRLGSHAEVSAEVAVILAGLNGRRRWGKGTPISREASRAAAIARRKAAQRATANASAAAGTASPETEDIQ